MTVGTEPTLEQSIGHLKRLAAQVGDDGVSLEAVQDLMELAVKLYARKKRECSGEPAEARLVCRPLREDSAVTATEAAMIAADMLDCVDLDVFELHIWKTFGKY